MVKLDFGNIEIYQSYAIVSRVLASNCYSTRKIQIHRMKTSPTQFYRMDWKKQPDADLRQATINSFLSKVKKWVWNEKLSIHQSPILPVIYVTDVDLAWEISIQGFTTETQFDGLFGRGIYFTTSARYRLPQISKLDKPAILICLSTPGNPFPVTEHHNSSNSMLGKSIKSGYQSHYVITTKNGRPFTLKDYENLETSFDELIIDQEAQVVPIFLLIVSTSQSRISRISLEPSDDFL